MVGAILLAIGSVLNFHKMRRERDAALADVSVRFDGMRYRFALDGIDGMASRGLRPGSEEFEKGYLFTLIFKNGRH